MSKTKDLILDINDFQCLVRYGILRVESANTNNVFDIALSSKVSFGDMINAVNRAQDKLERAYEPHIKIME